MAEVLVVILAQPRLGFFSSSVAGGGGGGVVPFLLHNSANN